jgi:hypothetical protein
VKLARAFLMLILGATTLKTDSTYNIWTGKITCTDRYTCLHEYGHERDHQSGWISKSKEFRQAVDVFNRVQWLLDPDDRHEWSERMHSFPGVTSPRMPCRDILSVSFWQGGWGGYTELYAEMWAWADGDIYSMPIEFKKFYAPGKTPGQVR